jgi:hypothetical protein
MGRFFKKFNNVTLMLFSVPEAESLHQITLILASDTAGRTC